MKQKKLHNPDSLKITYIGGRSLLQQETNFPPKFITWLDQPNEAHFADENSIVGSRK